MCPCRPAPVCATDRPQHHRDHGAAHPQVDPGLQGVPGDAAAPHREGEACGLCGGPHVAAAIPALPLQHSCKLGLLSHGLPSRPCHPSPPLHCAGWSATIYLNLPMCLPPPHPPLSSTLFCIGLGLAWAGIYDPPPALPPHRTRRPSSPTTASTTPTPTCTSWWSCCPARWRSCWPRRAAWTASSS